MKRYVLLSCLILPLFLITGCDWMSFTKSSVNSDQIRIEEDDQSFNPSSFNTTPGKTFKKTLFNELEEEALTFYLLKQHEDPILIQHIFKQQGQVPKEYYLYKSEEIPPLKKAVIEFTSPEKVGVYHFVGVTASPKDTLYGNLHVKADKKEKNIVMQEKNDSDTSKN